MAQVHLAFKERNHRSSSVARNINRNRERLLSADAPSAVRAELIGDDICSALGVTMQSSSPVLALCRRLIEAGHDSSTPLETYRGGTLAIRVKSIGQAAQLEPSPTGAGFVRRHFRLRAAPPIAPSALALSEEPGPIVSTIANARGHRRRVHTRAYVGGNQETETPMTNVTLLKQPTEADNKERSEVVSENSNVPTVNGGNLPAQLDHDIDVLLQETARSNPILRWKQETNYRIGEDERELGRQYIAHAREWSRGYVRWEDGEIVEHHVKRVVDDPTVPPREAMGHNDKSEWEAPDKDPVCLMNYLPLTDLETGEFVVFSSATTGGKIAIEKLCNQVAREIKAGRKSGEPIIRLATGTFKTRFGEIKTRPDFPISGWVDQEPIEEDLDDAIPF